jgi:hypothetical protein
MTNEVPFPETEVRPPPKTAARKNFRAAYAHAKWCSIGCLTEIIDEPYSGDDKHDSSLRKAKISAANALLSADVRDVYRSERMIG